MVREYSKREKISERKAHLFLVRRGKEISDLIGVDFPSAIINAAKEKVFE